MAATWPGAHGTYPQGLGPGTHLQVPLLPNIQVDIIEQVHLCHCVQGGRVEGNNGELPDLYGDFLLSPGRVGGTSPSQGGVFLSDLNLRPEH